MPSARSAAVASSAASGAVSVRTTVISSRSTVISGGAAAVHSSGSRCVNQAVTPAAVSLFVMQA